MEELLEIMKRFTSLTVREVEGRILQDPNLVCERDQEDGVFLEGKHSILTLWNYPTLQTQKKNERISQSSEHKSDMSESHFRDDTPFESFSRRKLGSSRFCPCREVLQSVQIQEGGTRGHFTVFFFFFFVFLIRD